MNHLPCKPVLFVALVAQIGLNGEQSTRLCRLRKRECIHAVLHYMAFFATGLNNRMRNLRTMLVRMTNNTFGRISRHRKRRDQYGERQQKTNIYQTPMHSAVRQEKQKEELADIY
jgi:hypothetical protein